MSSYAEFYRRSIDQRDIFWAEQARLIDWNEPPRRVCDYSNPPFARWFVGGTTNICHNAVDRHLKDRASQPALRDHFHRNRHRAQLQLRRAARRGAAHGGQPASVGRKEGRPRAHLHAHDCRGRLCDAGVHPYRGAAFGGVWRFCLGLAGVSVSKMPNLWPSSVPMPVRAAARVCPTSRCSTRPFACRATNPPACCWWTGAWRPWTW